MTNPDFDDIRKARSRGQLLLNTLEETYRNGDHITNLARALADIMHFQDVSTPALAVAQARRYYNAERDGIYGI